MSCLWISVQKELSNTLATREIRAREKEKKTQSNEKKTSESIWRKTRIAHVTSMRWLFECEFNDAIRGDYDLVLVTGQPTE